MNTKIIISVLAILMVSTAFYQTQKNRELEETGRKKVNVWDTYVTKKNGSVMHFDIIAPVEVRDTTIIYGYGKEYLKTKGQDGQPLTSRQCRFCHIEYLRPEWQTEIDRKGYFIIEMEGCN